ncbi:carboxylating nicotinate-nucleotide diphosphorylase [Robiginitomaculum antarcticum]|uniref:carboxylating nicotinate-nucleotide diphosphorylase n=1 Tax=Robiginitomaculum antarcticum TaxID=437507 RepID=UPI0003628DFC|nr:carboxylating nicotinate-nucleotide diphosphorylase [Robiginitomaculum antarcticum]
MTDLPPLPRVIIEPMVRRALIEDFGNSGDLTANILVPDNAHSALSFRPRETGIICGQQLAALTYELVDSRVNYELLSTDGTAVKRHDVTARVDGPARSLLSAERVALNFMGRMSGIATLTSRYVEAVRGTSARIAATRKTTPGLRAIEKYAVLAGGGYAHRESLAAAIMIKDNHIALAGGVDAALSRIKARADHMAKISVEVDTLEQFETVLSYEPDVILLDNMSPAQLSEAVKIAGSTQYRRPTLEASGGVNLDTVAAIAASGVDVISVGALTHSAPNFDVGLDAI